MSTLISELRKEILMPDCNVLSALRKAHLIASKLELSEFDKWIQSELNGYSECQDDIPDYRQVRGQVKAWNPYNDWVPVIFPNSELEKNLCTYKLNVSIGEIAELYNEVNYCALIRLSADVTNVLNSCNNFTFNTYNTLHISKHSLKVIIDKVVNCLLEWTLKLEEKGIIGENMTFTEKESSYAKEIPQQINHYYGNVINGTVSSSQITSGDSNTITYNAADMNDAVREIRDSLSTENISSDDMDSAVEILDDISKKIEQNKKPSIIKSALMGLKDFVLARPPKILCNY